VASQPTQIQSLQTGRALAALIVLMHHAASAARDFSGPIAALEVFRLGYLGFDFFFVLSGFIIYHSARGKSPATTCGLAFAGSTGPTFQLVLALPSSTHSPKLSANHREWGWLPTPTLLPLDTETALSAAWSLKHEILLDLCSLSSTFRERSSLAFHCGAWRSALPPLRARPQVFRSR
jgi:hypothetical protein